MKLTKSQRHVAYIIILHEYTSKPIWYSGCCGVWNYFLPGCSWLDLNIILPELYDKRTDLDGAFWFKNRKERIKSLKQCIEETY